MPSLPNPSPRLRGIDALRGIAALGVVVYHAVEQGKNALPNNLLDYPVRSVQFLSSFGYIGVFLFLVIWICERPFMIRRKKETADRRSQWTPAVESQPSTVSD